MRFSYSTLALFYFILISSVQLHSLVVNAQDECWGDVMTLPICDADVLEDPTKTDIGWCFQKVGNSCAQGGVYVFESGYGKCDPCINTMLILTNIDPTTCQATAYYHQTFFDIDDAIFNSDVRAEWTGYAYNVAERVVLCDMQGTDGPMEKYSTCGIFAPPTIFSYEPFRTRTTSMLEEYETEVEKVCCRFETDDCSMMDNVSTDGLVSSTTSSEKNPVTTTKSTDPITSTSMIAETSVASTASENPTTMPVTPSTTASAENPPFTTAAAAGETATVASTTIMEISLTSTTDDTDMASLVNETSELPTSTSTCSLEPFAGWSSVALLLITFQLL